LEEIHTIRILKLSSPKLVDPGIVSEAAACLKNGKLIVIPTDTVYGVAADFFNKDAVARLHKIKKRPLDKPIPILASDPELIEKLGAEFGEIGKNLARRYWPGPLTLVLPVGKTGDVREGFRIPDHESARAIIRAAGGLLRVTSANLSGNKPALTVSEALKELSNGVVLFIDGGRSSGGVPSTVVEIAGDKAVILREGAIPAEEIMAIDALNTKNNDKKNYTTQTIGISLTERTEQDVFFRLQRK